MIPFIAVSVRPESPAESGDRRNRWPPLEKSRQVGQDRVFAVFVGDQRFIPRNRPGDAERGIAPQEAAIMLGRIVGAHLVDNLRIGLQRAIAVGNPSVCRRRHRRSTPTSHATAWLGQTAESGSGVHEPPPCSPIMSGCLVQSECQYRVRAARFPEKPRKRSLEDRHDEPA
jgi:hypothetical protein